MWTQHIQWQHTSYKMSRSRGGGHSPSYQDSPFWDLVSPQMSWNSVAHSLWAVWCGQKNMRSKAARHEFGTLIFYFPAVHYWVSYLTFPGLFLYCELIYLVLSYRTVLECKWDWKHEKHFITLSTLQLTKYTGRDKFTSFWITGKWHYINTENI